jgi:hypothetical protein
MTVDQTMTLIENLLAAQLALEHERPRDAFPVLVTNKLAAGYVFGFHDSCFQIFGHLDRNEPDKGFALIKASYQSIFGDQPGLNLFNSSVHWQNDPDFQIGRLSGGEEYAEFTDKGTPPLGLQRILLLGFDAAAVWRGLKSRKG